MNTDTKEEKKDEKKAPETGKGSPAGPRWFVSKNPGLVLEVVAQRYPDNDGNVAPFIRVPFKSESKSALHVGRGYLGTDNKLGTDTNANKHYGVFFVMDPGPLPKDGYKSDEDVPKDDKGREREDWMRTAEEKARDRRIIDHIRKTYMYRHSPQDNQYRVTARLVELNWDPSEMNQYVESLVIPGMNRPMKRPPLAGAPEEESPKVEQPTSPQMGRRRVPAV